MNIADGFLSAYSIATSIALVLGALWFIPSCMRSVFRYRLWQIRDRVFDEVTDGTLPDEGVVDDFIRRVEAIIRMSRHVTLYKFAVIGAISRWDLRDHEAYEAAMERALSPESRARLKNYEYEVAKATAKHLLFGSPSGWLSGIIVLPIIALNDFRDGQRNLIKNLKRSSLRMGTNLSSEEKISRLGWDNAQDADNMSAFAN